MTAVCLIHSAPDRDFALDLSRFLETGCDVVCYPEEGDNVIEHAERLGLSGDVLVVLLSKGTCAAGWPDRSRWESVLVQQARDGGVDIVFLQLDECAFPAVFRKQFPFFDASAMDQDRTPAMRLLKRWLWQRELGTGEQPRNAFSADLKPLYTAVADRAGVLEVSGATARRFATEASQEFEAVVWVPCSGRSLAQILGHFGVELRMALQGPVEENRERVLRLLAERRCLVILDGIEAPLVNGLVPMGRSSTLVTTDAVVNLETVDSYAHARELVVAGRLAEAHEMLERVSANAANRAMCQREIAWILNAWGHVEDANAVHPEGTVFAEQMSLFG